MRRPVVSITEASSGVCEIALADREHKNMFSDELIADLQDAFQQIGTDSNWRAVVLTGYDTYFCTGGTQEGLLQMQAGQLTFAVSNLYGLPLNCAIPVIAAMQGHAIGGGFVFGLFADVVVLSRESVYTLNFMRYGFTPGMGATLVVPYKLGPSLAAELLFSAGTYRGAQLHDRGVPVPVLPRAEVLVYSRSLAAQIAQKPRAALVSLKRQLTEELRARLPEVVQQELAMHRDTFQHPDVRDRIQNSFGT